jgi:hypothetical protein
MIRLMLTAAAIMAVFAITVWHDRSDHHQHAAAIVDGLVTRH